jgi:tRNA-dihydrouridine synthase B
MIKYSQHTKGAAQMKIGNSTLKYGLMLAPLAGYTNAAFREICASHGAEYTVSEMISAKAVCYGDKKTLVLARNASTIPMGLQLFGAEPEFIAKAIRILTPEEYLEGNSSILPAAFDINMGCPVHKIVSNGEGSALMRDPARAAEIVRAAVEASPVPVTVKIRAGYSESTKNAPELAPMLEDAGASLICVHGRTREQMYSGKVDLDIIREVKRAVTVPVVGNGDVVSAESALHMLEYTGCDGLMIGGGAVGDPWIFERIIAKMNGAEPRVVPTSEIAQTAKEHLYAMCELMGERRAVPEARKAICAYFRDFAGAPAARAEVNTAATPDAMCAVIDKILI